MPHGGHSRTLLQPHLKTHGRKHLDDPGTPYPEGRIEGELQGFPDTRKLKEFTTTQTALQKMLMGRL